MQESLNKPSDKSSRSRPTGKVLVRSPLIRDDKPYSLTVNKNTFAKFFYKRNPPSNIRQLEVEIEPINPDGTTDKRTFGLREGEIFHNTTIGSDGNFRIFGKDVTLDQTLLDKIKLRVYRKRGRFGPEEAQQQGEEHHIQEIRQQNLDKFLEIFYYPVKCLMEWITTTKMSQRGNPLIVSLISIKPYEEVNNKYFYTVNIRISNDDDDYENTIVGFDVEVSGQFTEIREEQFNELSNRGGSKRRKLSKRRKILKRRKLSKRRMVTKRRK